MTKTRTWEMFFDSIEGTIKINSWGRELNDHDEFFTVVVERQECLITTQPTNGPPIRSHPCAELAGKTVVVALALRIIHVLDDDISGEWEPDPGDT